MTMKRGLHGAPAGQTGEADAAARAPDGQGGAIGWSRYQYGSYSDSEYSTRTCSYRRNMALAHRRYQYRRPHTATTRLAGSIDYARLVAFDER